MNFRVSAIALQLALIISMLYSMTTRADVLVLKNGDRITGDIRRVWDSEISIEPDYSDEFKVDVEAIEHIESDREFEIDLEDGKSLLAQFDGVDTEGNQIITSADESLSVPLEQLFELDEPEEEFDWEGHIEFSATVNDGNTDSLDSKLRADTTVKINSHKHIGEIEFFREEQDGVSNKEQDLFRYSYIWLFNDPWFLGAQLTFERDPIIELDSRVIGSAGIGLDLWDTPRRALSVLLGAGLQTEEIGMESENSTVATWTLRYRQDFIGDDLELFHNHSITHNITGRSNTSYKTSTGFRFEITDLFYANVSLDYDFETEPVDLAENEDIALVLGIGAEF